MVLNGSVEQIAGVCNKEKNVFGLMPHPERAIELALGSDDGIKMLEGFKA
jgi:phosphoribosylformylglycinamidine synthase